MQEESCDWDLQKIRLLLPDYEEVIQRLKPSQAGAPDKMAWLGTPENWTSIRTRTCLPPSGVISETLGIWILWNLWKARNKFVFESHSGTPEDTVSIATVLAREWGSSQKKDPPPRLLETRGTRRSRALPERWSSDRMLLGIMEELQRVWDGFKRRYLQL
ncbi:hypothetical protein DY000_02034857 [Brassica cretica]|uniref:Uncharacterized protein n=1 Tax=Brassica cretica TaxID=69181 RepID=A0ABQ7DRH9_BRACR|nr:hypothetical protein DY000_02034857 [Brassica cretica]